ncbi:MAG: H-X9-DG-CTERM domain-containing protein [Planctomycetales bacterium]
MLFDAKRAIPWTKPEDIKYSADEDILALGGYEPGGFNALLGDGAVRYIVEDNRREDSSSDHFTKRKRDFRLECPQCESGRRETDSAVSFPSGLFMNLTRPVLSWSRTRFRLWIAGIDGRLRRDTSPLP